VWTLIAADASPENPSAQVHQQALAEKLGCGARTISRAITELTQFGLLCEAGTWNKGRCKIYRLNWNPNVQNASPEGEKSELERLLATHGESWAEQYACFDGVSGRPSLKESVAEALNHDAKNKSPDVKRYIDSWLRIASHRWTTKSKHEPTQPSPPEVPETAASEIDEERDWIIAQIKASNEAARRKATREAQANARYSGRGAVADKTKLAFFDEPICPENYPVMWNFLRMKWADGRRNMAA
jgi:hypothetical protein